MFLKYESIDDTSLLSVNMLGKSMNLVPLLMNGSLIKCLYIFFSESMYG